MLKKVKNNIAQRNALIVFLITAFYLMMMSGIYHSFYPGLARNIFQRLDYSGIFALIAGTFTIVQVLLFRGWWRWSVILLVWISGIIGITLIILKFDDLSLTPKLAILLGQGWLSGLAIVKAFKMYALKELIYGLTGGLIYTSGTYFLVTNEPVISKGIFEGHEVWHFFVVAGLSFHLKFVWDRLNILPAD